MAHGGNRPGAGRKAGLANRKTREIAERALSEDVSPLEVMLENMRHFRKVARDAEAVLEGLTVQEITGQAITPEDQFKLLLAKAKQAAGFRQAAQDSARDAAPYVHPRLSAIEANIAISSHEDFIGQFDEPEGNSGSGEA